MNRNDEKKAIDLSKGPIEVELINNEDPVQATKKVKYQILDILYHRGKECRGNTCVCYKAIKKIEGKKDETVLLKVFYPRDYESEFTWENGLPVINVECKELLTKYQSYIKSIHKIQEYMTDEKYKEIRKYLCVEKDFEPLFAVCNKGLSTVYCENLYRGQLYWLEAREDKEVGLSQIMQTSISVMEFLKLLHEIDDGIAYVDIKPEDVLIKRDEMDTINFSNVLFFDLEAALEFGVYEYEKIRITEEYRPDYFMKNNEIEIGNSSENCTYAKGIKRMVENKISSEEGIVEFKTDNGEIHSAKEFLDDFLKGDSLADEIARVEEDDVIKKLSGVKVALENDEKINRETKDLPKFECLGRITSFILIILYIVFAFASYNTMTSAGNLFGRYNNKVWVVLAICIFIIIDTFLIYYFAQKYSYLKVSSNYFDAKDSKGGKIRNAEYNAFRLGKTRKKTTFQDESVLHKLQQNARHIWWIVLGLGICVGCVGISVLFKTLPLFFAIGIILILTFMWADYLPASKRDLKTYLDFVKNDCKDTRYTNNFFEKYCLDLDESVYDDINFQKAVFYGDEYVESLKKSDCPFCTNSKYYYNDKYCRHIDRMREWAIKKGYSESDDDVNRFLKELPSKKKYDERMRYVEEKQIGKSQKVDLNYGPLQMKQIYKMTFDRLRNEQLINNLILLVLSILTVAFVGLYGNKDGINYACLPEDNYVVITMTLLIASGLINIYQTFNAKAYERVVAEMAYKSRFVNVSDTYTFTLNELLLRDIVTGYVQEIDIVRGTTRYQGSVMGKVDGESDEERKWKINQFKKLNRPLLHFRQQAYRRHLLIIVWSIFFIIFSIVVWMCRQYWMFLPLLIFAILTQITWEKFILPAFGKQKLINNIERCIKDYEDRQR